MRLSSLVVLFAVIGMIALAVAGVAVWSLANAPAPAPPCANCNPVVTTTPRSGGGNTTGSPAGLLVVSGARWLSSTTIGVDLYNSGRVNDTLLLIAVSDSSGASCSQPYSLLFSPGQFQSVQFSCYRSGFAFARGSSYVVNVGDRMGSKMGNVILQ